MQNLTHSIVTYIKRGKPVFLGLTKKSVVLFFEFGVGFVVCPARGIVPRDKFGFRGTICVFLNCGIIKRAYRGCFGCYMMLYGFFLYFYLHLSQIMGHSYDHPFCFYFGQALQMYAPELVGFDVAKTGFHVMATLFHSFSPFRALEFFAKDFFVLFRIFIDTDLPVAAFFPLTGTALMKEGAEGTVFALSASVEL
jgi:hypothetical protein